MPIAPVVGQAGTHNRPLTPVRAIAAATLLLTAALALPGCSKPAGATGAAQAQLPSITVAAPSSALVSPVSWLPETGTYTGVSGHLRSRPAQSG